MHPKTDKIIALAKDGMPPREIAQKLQLDQPTIYGVLSHRRRKGDNIPRFNNGRAVINVPPPAEKNARSIVVPNRLHSLLEREAERRGKTLAETAQHLLETALLSGVRT